MSGVRKYWTETDADLGPLYVADGGNLVADIYVWQCERVDFGPVTRTLKSTGKRALALPMVQS